MTTVVTVTEPQITATIVEDAITATIVNEDVTVTVDTGVTDHGALTGLSDDDHAQYLLKAGGTMTGALVLDGDPAQALEAATKQYVDNNAGGGGASDVGDLTTAGLTSPNMLRVAAAGGLEERTPAQVLADIGAIGGSTGATDNAILRANGAGGATAQGSSVSIDDSGNILMTNERSFKWADSGGTYRKIMESSSLNAINVGMIEPGWGSTLALNVGTIFALNVNRANASRQALIVNARGYQTWTDFDWQTNVIENIMTLRHTSEGTPAAGFGAAILIKMESSTTNHRDAARIAAVWETATDASRKADLVLSAYDTAEREGLRIRATGSAAAIGFLGATPSARLSHIADPSGGVTEDAEARTAINSILTVLETFGLVATS